MTESRLAPFAVAIVVVAAAFLMLVPVKALYINDVGSDTIEYRTASCGAPVAVLLGADPGLGGGSVHRLGRDGPRAACDAAAGKRVAGGLLLLVVLASVGWFAAVRERRNIDAMSVTT